MPKDAHLSVAELPTAAGVPTNGTVGIDKPYTFLGPGKRLFIMSEGHLRMVFYVNALRKKQNAEMPVRHAKANTVLQSL
jgi:hypothetical protein